MTEQVDVESYFDLYDDLAVEVVDDCTPNHKFNLGLSNCEMAEAICQTVGVESFDLLEHVNFADVYANEPPQRLLAYAFYAFLRWHLFTRAHEREVGDSEFNMRAAAHSEYWYLRLTDRRRALLEGQRVQHRWIM